VEAASLGQHRPRGDAPPCPAVDNRSEMAPLLCPHYGGPR
jgi:hypothetical protein